MARHNKLNNPCRCSAVQQQDSRPLVAAISSRKHPAAACLDNPPSSRNNNKRLSSEVLRARHLVKDRKVRADFLAVPPKHNNHSRRQVCSVAASLRRLRPRCLDSRLVALNKLPAPAAAFSALALRSKRAASSLLTQQRKEAASLALQQAQAAPKRVCSVLLKPTLDSMVSNLTETSVR